MSVPTAIINCSLAQLASGWTFFSPAGSKPSFHFIFGELKALGGDLIHADLVSRTLVAYEEELELDPANPLFAFVQKLVTPDGLCYFLYEQLWCPLRQTSPREPGGLLGCYIDWTIEGPRTPGLSLVRSAGGAALSVA